MEKKIELMPIDWEQRRYEIAKEVMVKTLPLYSCSPEQRVETAIELADTLIEALKNKSIK